MKDQHLLSTESSTIFLKHKNNMTEIQDSTLPSFLSFITPATLAIIWLESQNLNTFPKYFPEMDYLLDGQLKNFINEGICETKPDEVSLFVNKHFNSNLYLLYLLKSKDKKNKEITTQLKGFIEVIKKTRQEKQNVIVLGTNENNTAEEIINFIKISFPDGDHKFVSI